MTESMKDDDDASHTHGRIDPHVHCRDWNQSYKATIKSVTELARSQGVAAIIDMPNTDPPITSEETVNRRLETARSEGCIDGYYLYIGATRNQKQIMEAARIAGANPRVAGIKLFAGKSTGDLDVSDEMGQEVVYDTLARCGYKGVLAVHCEKESLFRPRLWDPRRPYTWNLARPPEAEVASVADQTEMAKRHGFKGHLHILHVSVPEAVRIVDEARHEMGISCGATPHHLTLSTEDMRTEEGIRYKVNPLLRDPDYVKEMMALLKEGKIDLIETDHAPHSKEEKTYDPGRLSGSFMSGIESLRSYGAFIDMLSRSGFSEEQIRALTYSNAKRIFKKITE